MSLNQALERYPSKVLAYCDFPLIRFIRRRCAHLHDIYHKLGVDSRTKLTR